MNARWYPAGPKTRAAKQAIIVMPQWNADAFSHNALCAIFNRMGISALRLSKPYHDIRRPAELERSDYAVSANWPHDSACARQWWIFAAASTGLSSKGYEQFGVWAQASGPAMHFWPARTITRIRVNAFNHASTAFGDVVWAGSEYTTHAAGAQEAG